MIAPRPPCARSNYATPAGLNIRIRRTGGFTRNRLPARFVGRSAWLTGGGDPIDKTRRLLLCGRLIGIKGLGGFQIACDATDESAVARLRRSKHRGGKPLALMARDLDVVRRYCVVTTDDETAPAKRRGADRHSGCSVPEAAVAASVAPGLGTLGFMLPNTPLHHLLLAGIDTPVVMTSGNQSGEPQCIGNDEALRELHGHRRYLLLHDRDIACRVDDSVVRRMGGAIRMLRRARGYAPAPLKLAGGFVGASCVLAMGGELKNSFCLLRDGQAILSHHMGDLENAARLADYHAIDRAVYCDCSSTSRRRSRLIFIPNTCRPRWARAGASGTARRWMEVQHHHAHLAACMAENGIALDAAGARHRARRARVLATTARCGAANSCWPTIAGSGGWRASSRCRCPAARRRSREPWRNAYAHIGRQWGGRVSFRHYEPDRALPVPGGKPIARAGSNDRARRQRSAGQFLRAAVRRGGGGGWAFAANVCCMKGRRRSSWRRWRRWDAEHAYRSMLCADGGMLMHRTSADVGGVAGRYRCGNTGAGVAARFHTGWPTRSCDYVVLLRTYSGARRRAGRAVGWRVPESHVAGTGNATRLTARAHGADAPGRAGQ